MDLKTFLLLDKFKCIIICEIIKVLRSRNVVTLSLSL